jgi:hypothetical protein
MMLNINENTMAVQPFFDIGNVILEPTPTFARIKERTHGWLPLLLTIVSSLVVMLWWVNSTDFVWLREHVMMGQADAKPEIRAAMEHSLTPTFLMWSTGLATVLGTPVLFAAAALYYFLAGKVMGASIGFGKWFGFAAWVSVPRLLVLPLSALQILTSHGRVAMEDLSMVSLNYLVFHLPPSSPWAGLLYSIDLPAIWTVVLSVIGLRVWTGCSTGACVTAALVPWVIVYGLWAAKIAFVG